MPPPPHGSMSLDVASAYAAAAARVGAWAVVSALVFRRLGPDAFAMLALVRSTIGLLSYTSLGLAPAMVRALAEALKPLPVAAVPDPPRAPPDRMTILSYESPRAGLSTPTAAQRVYAAGRAVALASVAAGLAVTVAYALNVPNLHRVPRTLHDDTSWLALLVGIGTVLRLLGEAPAGVLQVRRRIALDNLLVAACEVLWAVLTIALLPDRGGGLARVGAAFAVSALVLVVLRSECARANSGGITEGDRRARWSEVRGLLTFGVGVVVAQAADFLYAPTDYILINRLIGPAAVADYAPAVQIDAGLLLIVGGLSAVLLPRAALAHAGGDRRLVRRYYVRGTLAGAAALAAAALVVLVCSPILFRLWLGADLPATRAILPLVLVHTVVGGSGAVGRSILLAMGKVRPFTISVVVAGVANVLLSYSFVRFFGWGLRGIVLGTIVVVVARSAIWTPWYVLRVLREAPADAHLCGNQ